MIRLRLNPGDLERLRFAYSPLAEVAESLYVLQCGQIPLLHRGWSDRTRTRLRGVDMQVLRAIVPAPRPHVASFLLSGAREPPAAIDVQLAAVAACSTARLRADLEIVWRGEIPPETQRVLEHGGGPRIAAALHQYWAVAVKPFWPQIRAVLDADVAYRATRLAHGGIEALLSDLHPELELAEHAIQHAVALPKTTSGLAAELNHSMPAVSAHLAVLRRSGLVTSWRAGRRVLYQLTPLARSVLAASGSGSVMPAEPAEPTSHRAAR